MREAREALTAKLPCNMRALQLELFDVVTVTLPTFGWVAKEFEVLGWGFSIYAGVMLTLRETSAAIFDPGTGFATLDVAANTLLPKPRRWNRSRALRSPAAPLPRSTARSSSAQR